MEVFRISHAKWAGNLLGSGQPARWNSKGNFICYTGNSRALSCLELLVHLSGEQLESNFKLTIINIPDHLAIEQIATFENDNWANFENIYLTQNMGDHWAKNLKSSILKVPSAIIKGEFNFLINPQHPDFKEIKIKEIEDFNFDMRLK